jgi:hypothetical protein
MLDRACARGGAPVDEEFDRLQVTSNRVVGGVHNRRCYAGAGEELVIVIDNDCAVPSTLERGVVKTFAARAAFPLAS